MRGHVATVLTALMLASGCLVLSGCSDNGDPPDGGAGAGGSGAADAPVDHGTVGCLVPDMVPTTCPTPPVTYREVQPILHARCVSVCHNDMTPDPNNNNIPIWGLTTHRHISDWRDTVRSTLSDCTMPPPDAGVPVTIEERKAIVEFIRCGLPQ